MKDLFFVQGRYSGARGQKGGRLVGLELSRKRIGFTSAFKRFGGLQTSEEIDPQLPYRV